MADGRKNNGCKPGESRGQGRKRKAKEQEMIEYLGKYSQEANDILMRNVRNDEAWAVKIYFDRLYGKPKDHKEIEMNLTTLSFKDLDGMSHEERLQALKEMGI